MVPIKYDHYIQVTTSYTGDQSKHDHYIDRWPLNIKVTNIDRWLIYTGDHYIGVIMIDRWPDCIQVIMTETMYCENFHVWWWLLRCIGWRWADRWYQRWHIHNNNDNEDDYHYWNVCIHEMTVSNLQIQGYWTLYGHLNESRQTSHYKKTYQWQFHVEKTHRIMAQIMTCSDSI